jgi:hypothetical protein
MPGSSPGMTSIHQAPKPYRSVSFSSMRRFFL